MRLFVISRHGQSTLNIEDRVNGDPKVCVRLTEPGIAEARRMGLQLAQLPIDLCLHTEFWRTHETAAAALEGRDVPFVVEPLFNDIDVGELEGQSVAQYRAWKEAHSRHDLFPGGESLDDAAARYADAYRKLLALDAEVVFAVVHEIPLRYAINAAAGSDSLDSPVHAIPNATPFFFTDDAIERVVAGIDRLSVSV